MRTDRRRQRHARRAASAAVTVLCLVAMQARGAQVVAGDLLAVLAEKSIVRLAADGGIEPLFSTTGLQTLYGIAVERSGRVLALAVGGGTQLVRIDPADGSAAQVAILPAFGLPFSMAIDRAGRVVHLVDHSGDLIRVDLATGQATVLVSLPGTGVASFALARAADGALYVSDDAHDTLLRVDASSGASEVVAEGVAFGGFYRAHGIDVDREGRVVGARFDPPALLRVDPATGAQEVVAEGGLLDGPVEIEIDRDGRVLAGNLWAGDVVRVDLATGAQERIETPYLLTGLALAPHAECGNGRDDDGDGLADASADPGCSGAAAPSESPPCQDGDDNDGEIGIDFDGGAAANGGAALDVPDPQCALPWNAERRAACGLGIELTALAGVAAGARSRMRSL